MSKASKASDASAVAAAREARRWEIVPLPIVPRWVPFAVLRVLAVLEVIWGSMRLISYTRSVLPALSEEDLCTQAMARRYSDQSLGQDLEPASQDLEPVTKEKRLRAASSHV
jgi:hypothetical protein